MAGFLDALKSRCEVVELDGGRDWRHGTGLPNEDVERNVWFKQGDAGFEDAWKIAGGETGRCRLLWVDKADAKNVAEKTYVSVYGRRVPVPAAVGTACRFTFAELCEEVS
jgi:protein AFG1